MRHKKSLSFIFMRNSLEKLLSFDILGTLYEKLYVFKDTFCKVNPIRHLLEDDT